MFILLIRSPPLRRNALLNLFFVSIATEHLRTYLDVISRVYIFSLFFFFLLYFLLLAFVSLYISPLTHVYMYHTSPVYIFKPSPFYETCCRSCLLVVSILYMTYSLLLCICLCFFFLFFSFLFSLFSLPNLVHALSSG